VVNTGLYYLFVEKLEAENDKAHVGEYRRYADVRRGNLEAGLANLSML